MKVPPTLFARSVTSCARICSTGHAVMTTCIGLKDPEDEKVTHFLTTKEIELHLSDMS